jgi:hypothetical protein
MNPKSSRLLLVTALLFFLAFFWIGVTYTQTAPGSPDSTWRIGLPFSPWLILERHVSGSSGFEMKMHSQFLSWSTLCLVIGFILLRIRGILRRRARQLEIK